MIRYKSAQKVRRIIFQVWGVAVLLTTIIGVYQYIFRQVPIIESVINWTLVNLITAGCLLVLLSQVGKLQTKLDQKIYLLEKKAQRDAALTHLSRGFTATQEEDQIYKELVERLHAVKGYDHVAVFSVEESTGNRILQTEIVSEAIPQIKTLHRGEGISERAILDAKLHYSPDITKEPAHVPGLRQGSEIDVPIEYGGKVMGVVVIESEEKNAFDQNDFELLTIASEQAALALNNARLYQGVLNSAEHQAILYRVSQEIIKAGLDLEQVYQSIHQATEQLMPADSFVISVLDKKADEIDAAYLYDQGTRTEAQRVPIGQGLSGHIIATGKPLLLSDYRVQGELEDIHVFHFGNESHVRSLLAVPLLLGQEVTGMLSAQTYKTYDYTQEDQQLLEMLAAYAAIAIDNARLFSEIQRLAITDSLTGAFNRRHFISAAQKELARAQRYNHPVALMMLDLDYYKEINDTYGHNVGDQALRQITQLCQEGIREVDILARYGGDEFIILLPETTLDQAAEIAERLRSNMESSQIEIDSITISTTLSIGVSGTVNKHTELTELLKWADVALYKAKQAGRNRVRIRHITTQIIRKQELPNA